MTALDKVEHFLQSEGLKSGRQDSELQFYVSAKIVGCKIRVFEHAGFLKCLGMIPILVPDYRRNEMAAALCRANWSLHGGAFEMDFSDGECRFRDSLPLLDGDITNEQLRYLIIGSWSTISRYAMALIEVAVGHTTAELAIERAEASWLEEQRSPSE